MTRSKLNRKDPRARAVLRAAEDAILGGLDRASAFVNAQDFKHSLIGQLHLSKPFARAAKAWHGPAAKTAGRRGDSEIPRSIPVSGRAQASRRDPSLGQRDRQRGSRAKGGKRQGQQKNR